jgi:hypothetical protein
MSDIAGLGAGVRGALGARLLADEPGRNERRYCASEPVASCRLGPDPPLLPAANHARQVRGHCARPIWRRRGAGDAAMATSNATRGSIGASNEETVLLATDTCHLSQVAMAAGVEVRVCWGNLIVAHGVVTLLAEMWPYGIRATRGIRGTYVLRVR